VVDSGLRWRGVVCLGCGAAGSDQRWWLFWCGTVLVVAGLTATMVSMLGRRGTPSAGARRLVVVGSVLMGIAALVVLLASTSSDTPSPSLAVDLYLLAPLVLGAGAVWIAACVSRLMDTLDRPDVFALALSSTAIVVAVVGWVWMVPVRVRVDRDEAALTAQAARLVQHPEWFGPNQPEGHRSGTLDLTAHPFDLGGFDVSAVELDGYDLPGCFGGAATGGLRFRLGNSSLTALIYCPERRPEPGDIHSTIDHLIGPWYLNSTFD
jgi:hypothetical protein